MNNNYRNKRQSTQNQNFSKFALNKLLRKFYKKEENEN